MTTQLYGDSFAYFDVSDSGVVQRASYSGAGFGENATNVNVIPVPPSGHFIRLLGWQHHQDHQNSAGTLIPSTALRDHPDGPSATKRIEAACLPTHLDTYRVGPFLLPSMLGYIDFPPDKGVWMTLRERDRGLLQWVVLAVKA